VRRGDIFHLGLMLAALGIAYVIPFELMLLAYAILGPAHYFTEMSWLHDRGYYLPHRGFGLALMLVAFGAMFIASPYWLGVVVWVALVVCSTLAAKGLWTRIVIGAGGLLLTTLLAASHASFMVLAALLPTVIHVSLFTLVFMLLGALRSRSPAQFALVGLYLAALALILLLPPTAGWQFAPIARHAQSSFSDIPDALGQVLGLPDLTLDARLMGLLSFVYTYHYLNWFIKAEVIHWHQIPRRRLIAVVVLSVAATAFYFIDFKLGFTVLLLVSLMHVLLEFPLNSLAVRELGQRLGAPLARGMRARLAPATPGAGGATTGRTARAAKLRRAARARL
jgi:hypothetical protein